MDFSSQEELLSPYVRGFFSRGVGYEILFFLKGVDYFLNFIRGERGGEGGAGANVPKN